MVNENVTISIQRYNELKDRSDFFQSNYIVGRFEFSGDNKKMLWTKDEVVQDIEDYYNKRLIEYKDRIRLKYTFKFWKWKLYFKINR